MILPLPPPIRSNRKIKPPRWDRYYDEPVPGDYWGRGVSDDDSRGERAGESTKRVH